MQLRCSSQCAVCAASAFHARILCSLFWTWFWLVSWLLRSVKRKFLCTTVVSEICATSLGKIQMTLWFNPRGAVALNHRGCCWHTSPQKPGSRWYKFICVSTGENSGSLELQRAAFASVLNTFGEGAGSAPPRAPVLLCFSPWDKLSSRSCCLSEYTAGTLLFIPSDTTLFIQETQIREPKIFISYLLLKKVPTGQMSNWPGHPVVQPPRLFSPGHRKLGCSWLELAGTRSLAPGVPFSIP